MEKNVKGTPTDRKAAQRFRPPVDLGGLAFSVCNGDDEFDEILECRWRGYKKYGYASPSECGDAHDGQAIQYLCKDSGSGEVVGCLRMLSKLHSPLEIEGYVNISGWATHGIRPAELTRLSVPLSERSNAIKFGLWKIAFLDALNKGHTHLIAWIRKGARRDYDMLGFHPLPVEGCSFRHPRLKNRLHDVIIFDIVGAEEEYRANRPALYQFFFATAHSNIVLPGGGPSETVGGC